MFGVPTSGSKDVVLLTASAYHLARCSPLHVVLVLVTGAYPTKYVLLVLLVQVPGEVAVDCWQGRSAWKAG